jgi:hypothetical protein
MKLHQKLVVDFGRLPDTFKPSYHAYRLLGRNDETPAGNFSARYQIIVGRHNEEA